MWGSKVSWRLRGKARVTPISEGGKSREAPTWVLVVFFGIFFLVGIGATYGLFVVPILKVLDAKNWPKEPCAIVSSQVKSHKGDKSTTYSIDIVYTYSINGRSYRSDRYDFMGGSSSGYDGKKAIVNRFRPGAEDYCYVNPKNPNDAVLEPRFSAIYLLGLIPLVFAVVGAGGLLWAFRRVFFGPAPRTAQGGGAAGGSLSAGMGVPCPEQSLLTDSRGRVILKSKATPFQRLVGVTLVAIFWNGIVSIFAVMAVRSFQAGHPEWFLALFITPFVLVGLFLVGAIGHEILALQNPRPRITLSAAAAPLGGTLDVEWQMEGSVSRINRLRITLIGQEKATYRRGTRTYTDEETFLTIPITEVTTLADVLTGRARFTVPANTMHSFKSAHNEVLWNLIVHGEIVHWPDIKETFPILVLPKVSDEGSEQ